MRAQASEPVAVPPEPTAKKPRVTRKKKETAPEVEEAPPPPAAVQKPSSKPAAEFPVQVDARFFAGLSTTLKQMNRAERVQRLSSFAVA